MNLCSTYRDSHLNNYCLKWQDNTYESVRVQIRHARDARATLHSLCEHVHVLVIPFEQENNGIGRNSSEVLVYVRVIGQGIAQLR